MITLQPMTLNLAHLFYKEFAYDPVFFSEEEPKKSYVYTPEWVNEYCSRQKRLERIHLAILRNGEPVGEILFKALDQQRRSCVFSIHLQNDSVKNQGIGTEASVQALKYAFSVLDRKTVYADALIRNKRSRHVLEKVGFSEIDRDEEFCYYRYTFDDGTA